MHKILICEWSLKKKKNPNIRSSLAVQWLGFGTLIAWVQVQSLGQETKILQAVQSGQKNRQNCVKI